MVLVDGNHTFSSTFSTLGTYSYAIWASDTSGNIAVATGQFTAQDTLPPLVIATGGGKYEKGTRVLFDASDSTDNSAIINVSWSFEYDGSNMVLYGPRVEFTFDVVGEYEVNLTLIDAAGLRSSQLLKVSIQDARPPARPSIKAIASVSGGCLMVTWDAVMDPDLDGYRVSRWNASSGAFEVIAAVPSDATSYLDCNLMYDSVYSYSVISVDESGKESDPSPITNGRTAAPQEALSDIRPYQMVVGVLLILNLILATLVVLVRRPVRK